MEQYYNENTPSQQNNNRGFASGASLFLSIVAVFGSTTVFVGVLAGIAAIACGIIHRVNHQSYNLNSILGIVIGAIAILLSCVLFLGVLIMLQNPETLAEVMKMMDEIIEMQ